MALLIVRAVHVCRLYRERLSQVNSKLAEVEAGRAAEYLEPLAVLLENMQVRTKVAGNWNRQRPAGAGDPPHTHTLAISNHHHGVYSCLCQVSTESCVWSQSSTSTTARPRQHVNTGRSETPAPFFPPITALFARPLEDCFHLRIRPCAPAEWEAATLRHSTKRTGGENKKAGGRPAQHWHHIR